MKRNNNIFFTLFLVFAFAAISANAQENKFFTHTVSKGQTLYSISKMYGTTVEEIVEHNPECAAKLPVGHVLTIPQRSKAKTQESITPKEREEATYHTIKSGETLYRLGKMYNITPQEICEANPGLSISNFRTGEVVLIPEKKVKEQETAGQKRKEQKKAKTHKVKRGESIEDICAIYDITERELKEANPGITDDNLKRNTILTIPARKETGSVERSERELSNNEIFERIEEQKDSVVADKDSLVDENAIRVAVILPFLLDSYAPNEQGRMVEYYQGLLMAVKELKEKGYSYEINTFDSGHKENSLDSLLSSGSLDRMDLIIGALYPNHNKELARYAKENGIPLVIPFTSKEDEIFRNPMVYIVNSMQSYIIPEVTARFTEQFPNANVVFVEDTEKSNKKEFITYLTDELDKNGIAHTTLPISNFSTNEKTARTLKEVLIEDKENFIIPTSSSSKMLNTLLPILVQTKILDETHRIPEYSLFGYPEWQIHAKDTRDSFYELDTYFYATFYSHYSMPESSKFQEKYINLYNRNIQNIYPRYGMLGYDTGYFFLLAASKYGKEMPKRINELEFTPVQTGFKFERVNNWGGLINKKVYFIHYTRDYNIEKIDFDK